MVTDENAVSEERLIETMAMANNQVIEGNFQDTGGRIQEHNEALTSSELHKYDDSARDEINDALGMQKLISPNENKMEDSNVAVNKVTDGASNEITNKELTNTSRSTEINKTNVIIGTTDTVQFSSTSVTIDTQEDAQESTEHDNCIAKVAESNVMAEFTNPLDEKTNSETDVISEENIKIDTNIQQKAFEEQPSESSVASTSPTSPITPSSPTYLNRKSTKENDSTQSENTTQRRRRGFFWGWRALKLINIDSGKKAESNLQINSSDSTVATKSTELNATPPSPITLATEDTVSNMESIAENQQTNVESQSVKENTHVGNTNIAGDDTEHQDTIRISLESAHYNEPVINKVEAIIRKDMNGNESLEAEISDSKVDTEDIKFVEEPNVNEEPEPVLKGISSDEKESKNRNKRKFSTKVTPKKESEEETDVIYSGYLTKEGAVFRSWKRRYFILRKNKVLYYHANPKTTTAKGQILLQNTQIKKIENRSYKGKENCFQLYSQEFSRTYYMFAETPEEMDIWIKKLRLVTYGYNESQMKWLVLGPSGCGKTSLIQRWTNGVYDRDALETKTVEKTICKTTTDDGQVIEIEINEGNEKIVEISSIDPNLIKDTICIILVFDLTNVQSWNTVNEWLLQLKEMYPDFLFILLGTKMDLTLSRVVKSVDGFICASKMDVDYMEATATSNLGDYSFGFIVDQLVRRGKVDL